MKQGLIYFVLGGMATLVVIFVLFLIDTNCGEAIPFIGPAAFGDVTIWRKQDAALYERTGIREGLYMAKNGIAFLTILPDKYGKAESVNIYDMNSRLLVTITSSPLIGRWCLLHYSGIFLEDKGKIDSSAEQYTDFNYDGCFDLKCVFKDGVKSKYIYKDGDWIRIEKHGDKKVTAASGEVFVFDSNCGWQQILTVPDENSTR